MHDEAKGRSWATVAHADMIQNVKFNPLVTAIHRHNQPKESSQRRQQLIGVSVVWGDLEHTVHEATHVIHTLQPVRDSRPLHRPPDHFIISQFEVARCRQRIQHSQSIEPFTNF